MSKTLRLLVQYSVIPGELYTWYLYQPVILSLSAPTSRRPACPRAKRDSIVHNGLEKALVNNGWSGNSVLRETVAPNVNKNAGIRGTVCSRELDAGRQLSISTSHLNLLRVCKKTVVSPMNNKKKLDRKRTQKTTRVGRSNLHSSSCKTEHRQPNQQCAGRSPQP